ncbi:MAG: T9SS type A sorting domain-containing protein [Ignavibacteria bacterium]
MKKFVILVCILQTYSSLCLSQTSTNQFDCFSIDVSEAQISVPFSGTLSPNRTDSSGTVGQPSEAFFPILVVFVQFKNEPSDQRNTWPQDSAPVYLNKMIAVQKNAVGDWWSWYSSETQILSSHWAEISRGKFHVISPRPSGNGGFSVILPKTAQEYFTFYNYSKYRSDSAIHHDIWGSIRSQGLIDWRPYDRWEKENGVFYFRPIGEADGYVDMIYKVMKSRGARVQDSTGAWTTIFGDYAGYASLGWNYFEPTVIDTFGTKINYSGGGSGLTVSFKGQLDQYIGTIGHEHGHFMYSGGHSTYSRVSYGFGYDLFYSPADMILNEYMTPRNATINSTNTLGDYSSRISGGGEILKVPITSSEHFLLVSRNKVSKWDRVMGGDVAQINPYSENSDYGKGLYIYHIRDSITFPGDMDSQQDMECADGLFDFDYTGQSAQQVVHDCFISGANDWYYYTSKKVLYENDSSNLYYEPPSNYTFRFSGDGISARDYIGYIDNRHIYRLKWWGEGEPPTNECNIGTDRLFTNADEVYTRFDVGGDRYDAWNPGYNEVFSPYSSPNTNTWTTNPSNQNSGIFIWHYTNSISGPSGLSYIKVYKGGPTETLSLDSVLHLTPPSRPMGLRVLPCDSLPTIDSYKRIKIRWNHNMEPDMENVLTGNKKYKIYRSKGNDMNDVPDDALAYSENLYEYLEAVDIHKDAMPYFVDERLVSTCTDQSCGATSCWAEFPVRYRIQAIDKFNDESVLSDFAATTAWDISGGEGSMEGDNLPTTSHGSVIPKVYSLKQNYPNPFNPVTNIQYDLPFDNFVTIKVYDLIGREVMSLVNEIKEAGSYIVSLNGSNLSSGIYYYKITAGSYEQVRKMILIK